MVLFHTFWMPNIPAGEAKYANWGSSIMDWASFGLTKGHNTVGLGARVHLKGETSIRTAADFTFSVRLEGSDEPPSAESSTHTIMTGWVKDEVKG